MLTFFLYKKQIGQHMCLTVFQPPVYPCIKINVLSPTALCIKSILSTHSLCMYQNICTPLPPSESKPSSPLWHSVLSTSALCIKTVLSTRVTHLLLDTIMRTAWYLLGCWTLCVLLHIIKTIKIYAVTAVKVAIVRTIGIRKVTPIYRLCFCRVLANKL